MDILEIISVDFDVTDQLLFIYSSLVKFLRGEKKGGRGYNRAASMIHLGGRFV